MKTLTKNRKKRTRSLPIKYPGGKTPQAAGINSLFPSLAQNCNKPADNDNGYVTLCEPYCGGLSVTLYEQVRGRSEIINDIYAPVMNFWRVLQDPEKSELLREKLEVTPFSEVSFNEALRVLSRYVVKVASGEVDPNVPSIRRAAAFFIVNRQSRTAQGKCFATLTRSRSRGTKNAEVNAWQSALVDLPTFTKRLSDVAIRCQDALSVIRSLIGRRAGEGRRVLFYLDPPYMPETRATKDLYVHEMDEEAHRKLLELLASDEFVRSRARFLLSGYATSLYDDFAEKCAWRRLAKDVDNKAASGKKKRIMTECIWMNYNPPYYDDDES